MKVCIYARVSTDEQSTDNQIAILQEWVTRRGYELVEVYRENESAWKSGHQREFSRLRTDVLSGKRKVDIVLVWALDRITREGIDTLLNIFKTFNTAGARIISHQESWTEIPNEMTPIFLAMVGFFAKWESDRKSDRTKAGLARARRGGTILGRPAGSRDAKPRKKSGYYMRYQK